MKIENSLEMLLPTVQFGNVKLSVKVGLDTVTDLARVEEGQKKFGINGDKNSVDTIEAVVRKMAVDELVGMKREVDKLSVTEFEHEKFPAKAGR